MDASVGPNARSLPPCRCTTTPARRIIVPLVLRPASGDHRHLLGDLLPKVAQSGGIGNVPGCGPPSAPSWRWLVEAARLDGAMTGRVLRRSPRVAVPADRYPAGADLHVHVDRVPHRWPWCRPTRRCAPRPGPGFFSGQQTEGTALLAAVESSSPCPWLALIFFSATSSLGRRGARQGLTMPRRQRTVTITRSAVVWPRW